MIFDVKITQSELNISSEIVSDKSLHFVVDFPTWIKGEKGDAFTYADFTTEQIEQLQQPALEAATLANKATKKANTVSDKVIAIEGTITKNEDQRITNENTRIENEKERSDGFSSAITLIGDKVEAAEKAITDATDSAKNAQEIASHPTYIGDDHYVYRWDLGTKTYVKTDIYVKGNSGEDGKSAYQLAVEVGYKGSETQFSAEQKDIVNNSVRLVSVEKNKADLGSDGYVLHEQINPLQGKQVGCTPLSGTFGNSSIVLPTSSFTYEILISNINLGASQIIVLNTSHVGGSNGRFIYIHSDRIGIYHSLDDSFYFNIKPISNGFCHLVIIYDLESKLITLSMNGQVLTKAAPTLKLDNNIGFFLNRTGYGFGVNIYQNRIFNKALTVSDILSLWNNGNPQNYRLKDKSSLFAEYLPEYLTPTKWTDSSGNSNNLSVVPEVQLIYGQNLNNGTYKGSALTPLFVARGAVFNDVTGFYELNGLTDITEAQMIEIYNRSNALIGGNWNGAFFSSSARTNFHTLKLNCTYSAEEAFRNSTKIEVIKISDLFGTSDCSGYLTTGYLMFHQCSVKNILSYIDCSQMKTAVFMFTLCANLEQVNLLKLSVNVSFVDSPKLTRESITYLIRNSANTAVITVTIHPTAKARLTEEDIALASSKNITIA